MDLSSLFQLTSDCLLCGCPVQSHQPDIRGDSPLICHFCHQRLPLSKTACNVCGLPLTVEENDSSSPLNSVFNLPCGKCLKDSPPFNRTIAAFHYQPPIDQLISRMKYSSQIHYIPLLCEYLIYEIRAQYQEHKLPSCIIAMPLHPKKLSSRGFNQAHLIAKQISKSTGINIISQGIRRIKNTQAQSGLDSLERHRNVKRAFEIKQSLPEHVAIVDDVVTTGMTVSELAKCAKKQGAKQIDVWCIARAHE